jgi:hypothetical protein
MNAMGMPIPTDLKTSDLGFLSAAEKTLQKYKDDQRGHLRDLVKKVDECWGCKGPHLWRDRRTKQICCPNKDVPGVAERAAKMHKHYLEDLKKKKGGWVQKNKIKFAQLTDEQKEIGRQYFLQQAQTLTAVPHSVAPAASTNTSVVTTDTGARSYPVVVIHNSRSCKPILPVSVDGQLPHITVILGHLNDPLEDCASVRALFDSGASLSSGSESFWLPLLKGHPNVVEDVFTSDKGEFQPIILGGIVCNTDGDMSGHTIELTLVVKLRLRYETKNHQPVFHTIAIGKSVGVNTIFGKFLIKSLQCTYDCYNNTFEAGLLNAPPFKITDMYPRRYDTAEKVSAPNNNPVYAAIVRKLTEYEDHMKTALSCKAASTDASSVPDIKAPAPKPFTYVPAPFGPDSSPREFIHQVDTVAETLGYRPASTFLASNKRYRVIDGSDSDDGTSDE